MCGLVAAVVLGCGAMPLAAQSPEAPVSVLGDHPDTAAPSTLLGERYINATAGISFRPPADTKRIDQSAGGEIVVYQNKDRNWLLRIARVSFPEPQPLKDYQDAYGTNRPGFLQTSVQRLKTANPGAQVLRQELSNIADADVGLIAVRYAAGPERFLTQQALIEANDQLYYVLSLTTPGAKPKKLMQRDDAESAQQPVETQPATQAADTPDDPAEVLAVQSFKEIVDSVKLLDRAPVREDQDERLFRTRALFVNIQQSHLIKRIIIPQQWFRLVRDGQDIGYSFTTEQVETQAGGEGIMIRVRGRSFPDKQTQIDMGAELFSTFDWKHETWAKITSSTHGQQKQSVSELGTGDRRITRVLDKENLQPDPHQSDPQQPSVRIKQIHTLNVTLVGKSGNGEPISLPAPPPWYVPQAISQLLPRLLPLGDAKTYMFAVYVSDRRQIMHRYIDVQREREVQLSGRRLRAIPILDKLGLSGIVTTHYVNMEHEYLGSVTEYQDADGKKTVMEVLPSDEQTLRKQWAERLTTQPEAAGAAGKP